MRLLLAALCGVIFVLIHCTQAQNTVCKETGCKNCTDAVAICTDCANGYIPNTADTQCLKCPSHCDKCNETKAGGTTCVECDGGYFLENGQCSECVGNCDDCSDDSTCATCNKGFLGSVATVAKPKECLFCSQECSECTDGTKCKKCNARFFLNGLSCTGCSGGCLACTSASTCTSCPDGEYWDSSTPTCKSCGAECMTCTLQGCTACNPGFKVYGSECQAFPNCKKPEDKVGCKECYPGYILESATQCTACKSLSASTCSLCMAEADRGRKWDAITSQCLYCKEHCLKCQVNGDCIKCASGYTWDNTAKTCTANVGSTNLAQVPCEETSGWYHQTSCKECTAWVATDDQIKCESCPSTSNGRVYYANTCAACTGYTGTDVNECASCTAAGVGNYWTGSACAEVDCGTPADLDTEAKCESCKDHVYGQCQACNTIHAECTKCADGACTECSQGFYASSGTTCSAVVCTTLPTTQELCEKCPGHYWNTVPNTAVCVNINCAAAHDIYTCTNSDACVGQYWDANATPKCVFVTCTTLPTTQQLCEACPGHYWDTVPTTAVCVKLDCLTATVGSLNEKQCKACRKVIRVFWNPANNGACAALNPTYVTDCSTSSAIDECNACEGFVWDVNANPSPACVAVPPAALTTEGACNHLYARKWASTACSGLIRATTSVTDPFLTLGQQFYGVNGAAMKACAAETAAAVGTALNTEALCKQCSDLYRWYGGKCLDKALTCNTFDELEECTKCPGQYWDLGATGGAACAALDCVAANLNSKEKCHGCPHKAWDGVSTCTNVDDCDVDGLSQPDCEGCRHYHRYWAGGACQRIDECTASTVEAACVCDGYRWDGSGCVVVAAQTDVTSATIHECTHLFGRVVATTCKLFATKPSAARDTAVDGTNPFYTSRAYFLYVDSSSGSNVNKMRAIPGGAGHFINVKDWCDVVSGYGWDTNHGSKHCHSLAPTECGKSWVSLHSVQVCGQCSGMVWEQNYCKSGLDCSKMATLTTQDRCEKCPNKVWENSQCVAITCPPSASSFTSSAARCKVCSKSSTTGLHEVATKQCYECPSNCRTCSDLGVCSNCMAGHYKDANGACIDCSSSTPTTQGACNSCPGVYWNNVACVGCEANCLTCSKTSCLSCKAGFIPDGKNCKVCLQPQTTCSQCGNNERGKYWDATESLCKACPAGCSFCNAPADCTGCANNYFLDNKACKPCKSMANALNDKECQACNKKDTRGVFYLDKACHHCWIHCKTCTNANDCTTCVDGKYPDIKAKKCKDCEAGNCKTCNADPKKCEECNGYRYFDNNNCVDCPSKCEDKMCENPGGCKACQKGYYLTEDHNCLACNSVTGCAECDSLTKCTKSAPRFFLNNYKPFPCLADCLHCTEETTCDLCDTDKAFVEDQMECLPTTIKCRVGIFQTEGPPATDMTCVDCREGSYIEICQRCDDLNCDECSPADKCTKCKSGYIKEGDTCQKCPNKCTECKAGQPQATCAKCVSNYFVDGDECKKCIGNCDECKDDKECTKCYSGYYKKTPENTCVGCPSACSECESDTKCTACKPYNFLNDTTCLACITNCPSCSNEVECDQCKVGYFYDSTKKECTSCSDSNCYNCTYDDTKKTDTCEKCKGGQHMDGSGKCVACLISQCGECEEAELCNACNTDYTLSADKKMCIPKPTPTSDAAAASSAILSTILLSALTLILTH